MRPLHRPMFRYGGPIKEGVMSGIREPHAGGGRAALVGNPVYPQTGGREHHADYWKNLWAAGKPILKSWATPWKKPKKVVQAGEKIVGNKNLQGIFDMTSKKSTGITSSPAAQNVWKNLKSFSFPGSATIKGWGTKAKDLAFKYPKSTLVGGAYAGPKIVANVPTPKWSGSWGIKDILVPDEIYNYETGRWFNPDDKDLKPSDKKILDEKITEKVTEKIVPEVPQKTDAEKRAERIQKYRDIMDIKGMNKQAAYKSLVDASKLIQESQDFKGDIKSGKLINQVIQAASKQFEKPAKTRDAIDTLILKGEIEKDIKASDPSNKMLNELRLLQGKKITEELNPSFTTLKAVHSKAGKKGQSGIDDAASEYATNNGVDFKGNIISKSDFSETLKDLKEKTGGLDEDVIITNWTNEIIKGKNTADGAYTVGDKIVIIKDSQVISVE